MSGFQVEEVSIPVAVKEPKVGKWDGFIKAFEGLDPDSKQCIPVPLASHKSIRSLRNQVSRALKKHNLRAIAHEGTHEQQGKVLRFWRVSEGSKQTKKRNITPEGRARISAAQKKRWGAQAEA